VSPNTTAVVVCGDSEARPSTTISGVLVVRRATAGDGPFLGQMLAVAADWRPGTTVRTTAEILAVPALARYVVGWPRRGDAGFIAEDGVAIGAAWWRLFRDSDAGYGFVCEDVPELSIGVAPGWRLQGIGTRLLRTLIAEARRSGLSGLSLSVELDNPAVVLYERLGFGTVGVNGGALTMALSLSTD
jgi:GNAT superfamily N-acetyltransferase